MKSAVALAGLLAVACGSSSPTAPSKMAEVDTTYQGSWSGVTAQGKQVSFSVSGNLITTYRAEYAVSGADCIGGGGGGGSLVGPLGASPQAAITDAAFKISVMPPTGSTSSAWTLAGSFLSNANATGTLDVAPSTSFYPPSCATPFKTTWTAQKTP